MGRLAAPQANGAGAGLSDAFSRLLVSLEPSAAAAGLLARPRHAHRLDAPTGGLLLAGKTLPGLRGLTRAFADRCEF